MGYVTIQTKQGVYVGTEGDQGDLVAKRGQPGLAEIFELQELEGSRIALKSYVSGKYVCAEEGGGGPVRANRKDLNTWETFQKHPGEDGYVVFMTSKNMFWCAEGGGGKEVHANRTTPGPWERFKITPCDDHLNRMKACCCGVLHPTNPHVRYEIESHRHLIRQAAEILKQHRNTTHPLGDAIRDFLRLWDDVHFQDGVITGIAEADEKEPYTGTVGDAINLVGIQSLPLPVPLKLVVDYVKKLQIYYKHFYDPDSGTNILNTSAQTALTEAVRYFNQSIIHKGVYQQGNKTPERLKQMGYALGLSLHYVTDLLQPMHAANFGNIFNPDGFDLTDWRHSGFEEYADAVIDPVTKRRRIADFDANPHQVAISEIDPREYENLAAIVKKGARNSKRVYTDLAKPRLDEKKAVKYSLHVEGSNVWIRVYEYRKTWGDEADQILRECVPFGEKMVATFFLYWMRFPFDQLVHQIYRQLLGRQADPSGLATYGEVLKRGEPIKEVIRSVGKSQECWDRIAGSKERSRRERALEFFKTFLARDEKLENLDDWGSWMYKEKWEESVDYVLGSKEYTDHFGLFLIPSRDIR